MLNSLVINANMLIKFMLIKILFFFHLKKLHSKSQYTWVGRMRKMAHLYTIAGSINFWYEFWKYLS